MLFLALVLCWFAHLDTLIVYTGLHSVGLLMGYSRIFRAQWWDSQRPCTFSRCFSSLSLPSVVPLGRLYLLGGKESLPVLFFWLFALSSSFWVGDQQGQLSRESRTLAFYFSCSRETNAWIWGADNMAGNWRDTVSSFLGTFKYVLLSKLSLKVCKTEENSILCPLPFNSQLWDCFSPPHRGNLGQNSKFWVSLG